MDGHAGEDEGVNDPERMVVREARPFMVDSELGGEVLIGVVDLFISFNVLLVPW